MWWKRIVVAGLSLVLLASCGGAGKTGSAGVDSADRIEKSDQAVKGNETTQTAGEEKVAKLDRRYDNIVVADFTIKPELGADYPGAAAEVKKSMVAALREKKVFAAVGTDPKVIPAGGTTLLVEGKIVEMRIVSDAARFWGGAFAGSSGIELELRLIDAATKKVVRTEKVSSWNNAWAASWTFGSSDRSLPQDMGILLAGYVAEAMPEK